MVTEYRYALSANKFALEDKLSVKSFIWIRNNNGPRTDPWGTLTLVFFHMDVWEQLFTFIAQKIW